MYVCIKDALIIARRIEKNNKKQSKEQHACWEQKTSNANILQQYQLMHIYITVVKFTLILLNKTHN